jgi:Chaperone of endosialidase
MKTIIRAVLVTMTFLYLATGTEKTQAVVPPPDGGYPRFNTAEGQNALFSLTTGAANTAVGWFSLFSDTEGSFNTAAGAGTLLFNTADANTAFGAAALLFNTTGFNNTAVGAAALLNNTQGDSNVAVGSQALNKNTEGGNNNAVGFLALFSNTTGGGNNAVGEVALFSNVTGHDNTAIGDSAGGNITGSYNVCIGSGVEGVAGENNTTRISNIYATVQPVVGTDPDVVSVNSTGRLGRGNVSSRRYKHEIKPMENASEALLALKPVTFRYNKEYDATQTIAFGLIAEEVAEVNPDLVGLNPKGQPESVRYEQINAMLLNEFLKEHRRGEEQDCKIQEQETTIAELRSEIRNLAALVNEQATELRRVSAQLQISNAAVQAIAKNP